MHKLLSSLLLVILGTSVITAQQFPPDKVTEAINAGRTGKETFGTGTCSAKTGLAARLVANMSFGITMRSARGRIANAAYQAKRSLKPFGPSDVTKSMGESTFADVIVLPNYTNDGYWKPTNVVLRPKGAGTNPGVGVQPATTKVSLMNSNGNQIEGLVAVFKLEEIPADFDFVVVSAGNNPQLSCHLNTDKIAEIVAK